MIWHFLLLVDDSEAFGPNPINAKNTEPIISGVAGFRIERSGVPFIQPSLVVPHVRKVRFTDK